MKGRDRGCSEHAMGLVERSFLMNMVEEPWLQLRAPLQAHMYLCTFTYVHTHAKIHIDSYTEKEK